ncbi:MAG: DUF1573 domain-containing protein [Bacteroidia bacterium]|nr:DUF1573 domain-containing protein [Bacteroidia bacterium]
MKNQILFLGLAALIASCEPPKVNQNEPQISTDVINIPSTASDKPVEPGMEPQLTFTEETHDFGKIMQGEKVSYSFIFKNTGKSDLIISNASASCGCTVPNYPKTPVKPGEESKIDVVFDSSGKSGLVQKTVTLVTNCSPSTKTLSISTTIIVPEEE